MTAMSATKNLIIPKGETYRHRFTWNSKSGGVTQPIDLTSWTAYSQARATYDAATTIFDLTTENAGLVLGGTAGTIDMTVDDSITAEAPDEGVWDLYLVDPNGEPQRLLEGTVKFTQRVSRPGTP